MMAKKPKPPDTAPRPSFRARISGVHWAYKVGIGVLAFLGAFGGAAKTWYELDLPIPATRQYVQYTVNPTQRTIVDLQSELAEGKKEATDEALAKWKFELERAKEDNTRALIQSRIRDLETTKRKLDAQIDTLNRMRGQ